MANQICPIPVASPTAMAKKTINISFEVPGILRNLTSPKAP